MLGPKNFRWVQPRPFEIPTAKELILLLTPARPLISGTNRCQRLPRRSRLGVTRYSGKTCPAPRPSALSARSPECRCASDVTGCPHPSTSPRSAKEGRTGRAANNSMRWVFGQYAATADIDVPEPMSAPTKASPSPLGQLGRFAKTRKPVGHTSDHFTRRVLLLIELQCAKRCLIGDRDRNPPRLLFHVLPPASTVPSARICQLPRGPVIECAILRSLV